MKLKLTNGVWNWSDETLRKFRRFCDSYGVKVYFHSEIIFLRRYRGRRKVRYRISQIDFWTEDDVPRINQNFFYWISVKFGIRYDEVKAEFQPNHDLMDDLEKPNRILVAHRP